MSKHSEKSQLFDLVLAVNERHALERNICIAMITSNYDDRVWMFKSAKHGAFNLPPDAKEEQLNSHLYCSSILVRCDIWITTRTTHE